MRTLIVFLIFVAAGLSAQESKKLIDDVRFVWAESGLTLRAAGASGAEKLAVVPYGAKVRLTGAEGDYVEVPVLRALRVSEEVKSLGWSMSANYLEVEWEGQRGWLYGGYLVRFPVPGPAGHSIREWLREIGGAPDTVMQHARLPDMAGRQSVYRYQNGITRTESEWESWGSTTVVIPLVGFSHGFLIADRFYDLTRTLEEYRSGEITDMEPTILDRVEDDRLLFTDEFGSLEIRRLGGVLVITSEGGC